MTPGSDPGKQTDANLEWHQSQIVQMNSTGDWQISNLTRSSSLGNHVGINMLNVYIFMNRWSLHLLHQISPKMLMRMWQRTWWPWQSLVNISDKSHITHEFKHPNPHVCSGFYLATPTPLKKYSNTLMSGWHMFCKGHLTLECKT